MTTEILSVSVAALPLRNVCKTTTLVCKVLIGMTYFSCESKQTDNTLKRCGTWQHLQGHAG